MVKQPTSQLGAARRGILTADAWAQTKGLPRRQSDVISDYSTKPTYSLCKRDITGCSPKTHTQTHTPLPPPKKKRINTTVQHSVHLLIHC